PPSKISPPILSASVVGYEPQVIHHHHRSSVQRLRGDSGDHRAPTEVPVSARACRCHWPLFPWERLSPQPCSPFRGGHPVSGGGTSHRACHPPISGRGVLGDERNRLLFKVLTSEAPNAPRVASSTGGSDCHRRA